MNKEESQTRIRHDSPSNWGKKQLENKEQRPVDIIKAIRDRCTFQPQEVFQEHRRFFRAVELYIMYVYTCVLL